MSDYDLITIGGGAAGFFGSITFAENAPGRRTLILEKSGHTLAKVKISGGGRCNVTHHCYDAKPLTKNYPRGEKSLIGPFSRWGAQDTVHWFHSRGVELKTEADGRMFPITDDSQTIIHCLQTAAQNAGVEIQTLNGAHSITRIEGCPDGYRFLVQTDQGQELRCRHLLLATGGIRLAAGAKLATALGHSLTPAVPSLFTFKIDHPLLHDLPGISVTMTDVAVIGTKLTSTGPLLITHWGVSGPGILRLSAWGARELAEKDYHFTLTVNWLPTENPQQKFTEFRTSWGKRQLSTRCPFDAIPKRLWARMLEVCQIPETQTWAQLTKSHSDSLLNLLTRCELPVTGKSINKDEFVTAGGVPLKEINLKTMESKSIPGLYFAGEIMDIDGITGGFNFQNAWTTGFHAGMAMVDFQMNDGAS